MKILITGSEGKIAKELIKILNEHELLLVDKKVQGTSSSVCNLAFDDLEFIREFSPEIIIHLAASFERTDESPQFWNVNYEDNIRASYRLNSIIASLEYCPKQYIFASSYMVYDPNLYLSAWPLKTPTALTERDDIMPRNLIGAAKLYGEEGVEFLQRNIHKNMKVTHARIFRVFGDGGQEFVSRLIKWKKMGIAVDVWRSENRFDYISASDCASAIKHLINKEGIFNVGTGESTSIRDIVGAIEPKIRHLSSEELYESSCADITLMRELGWEPKDNVIEWIKERL